MGYTLYGKNGRTLDVNAYASDLLAFLTFGVFEKVGLPGKCTASQCKALARIIRNKARVYEVNLDAPILLDGVGINWVRRAGAGYMQEVFTQGIVDYMKEAAEFFEICGGYKTNE